MQVNQNLPAADQSADQVQQSADHQVQQSADRQGPSQSVNQQGEEEVVTSNRDNVNIQAERSNTNTNDGIEIPINQVDHTISENVAPVENSNQDHETKQFSIILF